MFIAMPATAQTTHVVTSNAFTLDVNPGDGICADGNGACSWAAVANEIQNDGLEDTFIVAFDCTADGCDNTFGGRDFNANAATTTSITFRGPATILADGSWGLRIRGFSEVHVDNVTVLGGGDPDTGFPPADQGIEVDSTTLTGCSIANSTFGGLARIFQFGGGNALPCVVSDNFIGTTSDGLAIPNQRGVLIDADGAVLSRNTIGNVAEGPGIDINADGATLSNNWLGTDAQIGSSPNAGSGLRILGSFHVVMDNVVRFNDGNGIEIAGDFNAVHDNVVVGNGQDGILVDGDANCIGAPSCNGLPPYPSATGNLSSGNGLSGVYLRSGSLNVLTENRIGKSEDGLGASGNGSDGIVLGRQSDSTHIVGGFSVGNAAAGIFVDESDDNTIEGALIGVDSSFNPFGNVGVGVLVVGGSDNRIGNENTANANIIGANAAGIAIFGTTADPSEDNVIAENVIGFIEPNADPIGNDIGVLLVDTAVRTRIEGNDIEFSLGAGIAIESAEDPQGSAPSFTTIVDNIVNGSGACGITIVDRAVGISRSIVLTTIGSPDGANVIVQNDCGIDLGQGARLTTVQGNYIGLAGDGAPFGNTLEGIHIADGATGTTIGGDAPNRISANQRHGIVVFGADTTILGNAFGLDHVDAAPQDAQNNFIHQNRRSAIIVGADDVSIGQVGLENAIGSSGEHGIVLSGATNTVVAGNQVGTVGTIRGDAIRIEQGTNGATVQLNSIGNVGGTQVSVRGALTRGNAILSNNFAQSPWNNIPIQLSGGANNGVIAPTVFDVSSQTQTSGTTTPGSAVEVYATIGTNPQWTKVGDAVSDSQGIFTATHAAFDFRICTVTDGDNNTSEFGCTGLLPWEVGSRFFLDKGDADINGGTLEPGDILEYRLNVLNDTATGYSSAGAANDLVDAIPAHTTYVPGSLVVNGVANDDDLGDGIGFDVNNNAVVYNGNAPASSTLALTFQVRVGDGTPAETVIRNQATYVLQAADLSLNTVFSDDPDASGSDDVTESIVGVEVPPPSTPVHPPDENGDGGVIVPPDDGGPGVDGGPNDDGGPGNEPDVDAGSTEPEPSPTPTPDSTPDPQPTPEPGPDDEPACRCTTQESETPGLLALSLFVFLGGLTGARSRRRRRRV